MMRLPSRPASHVTEAASWRLLQSLAPDNWIVREVTERDYGIDAYVEIATVDGQITGELISVQLKGTASIDWRGEEDKRRATSPSIQTSTANYWERLPVPVFLFVADVGAEDVYFMSVEPSIRRNYGKLSSQDTVSFPLVEAFSLKNEMGPPVLLWMARRERLHRDFVFHLSNLVSHAEDFHHFIEMNQGRDSFMEVEADAHLRFRSLYRSCNMAASYLDIEWEIESLRDLYRRDREQFQDEYVRLHEHTLDYALDKIEAIFPRIVRAAIELIGKTESDYWRAHEPILHEMCRSNELEYTVRRIEEEIARTRG